MEINKKFINYVIAGVLTLSLTIGWVLFYIQIETETFSIILYFIAIICLIIWLLSSLIKDKEKKEKINFSELYNLN